ncbi:hypothetical protein AVEN_95639-1 [Araneus ventricosus]|uniref:Uncharacterized protein n=1 Tax=Araneus ventricosus TaxID=182803 RepID=A0A4Y2W4L9_ARAVE|nr:hypothetical protein AVEN_95639-1 [Araneus ventricosus]
METSMSHQLEKVFPLDVRFRAHQVFLHGGSLMESGFENEPSTPTPGPETETLLPDYRGIISKEITSNVWMGIQNVLCRSSSSTEGIL